jgi:MarR family transcriptional regulator for hemolysin
MPADPRDCAGEILNTVPRIIQSLRVKMRGGRGPDLTVPQFRTLIFFGVRPGAALSAAAEHVGLTPPSMSRLVDGLVLRGLLSRRESPKDRRRVAIELTASGRTLLEAAREATLAIFASGLSALPEAEISGIARAMRSLRRVFGAEDVPPEGGATQPAKERR